MWWSSFHCLSLYFPPIPLERVYSAGKNFIGKINPDVILPVKLKFYRQDKSHSYSAGKT